MHEFKSPSDCVTFPVGSDQVGRIVGRMTCTRGVFRHHQGKEKFAFLMGSVVCVYLEARLHP